MYVVVRTDLSLPQQLVQAAHAAHEAGLRAEPGAEPSNLIALQVPDKQQLEQAMERFASRVPIVPFYEPDDDQGLTAFATLPIDSEQRRHFSNFKLWRPL